MKIAIIGAGLAGLTAAHYLKDKADIHVFEKARGVGGRMSTRYADPYQFDHGAQYFTARSKAFQNFLKPLITKRLISEWQPRVTTLSIGEKPYKRDWFEPHYVATPKMNDLCKYLVQDIETYTYTRIVKIDKLEDKWLLHDEDGALKDTYDWVMSSMPQPQLLDLFPRNFKNMDDIQNVSMTGCFTMMIGFKEPIGLNWDAAVVKNSPIEWMAVNSSKPNRDTLYSMVVNTSNDWVESHIDDDKDAIQDILLQEVQALLGRDFRYPDYITTHKWRYANVQKPMTDTPFILDRDMKLGACGDWFIGGRVEAAFQSGHALALELQRL